MEQVFHDYITKVCNNRVRIWENFFKKYENAEEDGDISDWKKMTVTSKKGNYYFDICHEFASYSLSIYKLFYIAN
ncbi:hypothetical protein TNIN_205441 [Trichonephila inaurata madagascariensis]|uniref:Uncharacterized protein n=1 Tax=Trichonephila inaurata madagascariensis TaxID=2747483 RepID=A0A8X7CBD2_9ARAC|nr:hypothetical protein TNIN_205441 [Trichonephila inaurata madagascariensis]